MVREVGEFVGRRREMREARRALGGQKAGLVLHGIGGVGKSTLAAEVLRSLGGDAGLVVSKAGQVSGGRRARRGRGARCSWRHPRQTAAMAWPGRVWCCGPPTWNGPTGGGCWPSRSCPRCRWSVLLDNFEDNLDAADGGWQVRDPELAAFLAGLGAPARAEPAHVHLPVPVHAARGRRAAAGRVFTWARCRRPRPAS